MPSHLLKSPAVESNGATPRSGAPAPASPAQPERAWFSMRKDPRPEISRELHMPAGLLGSMGQSYRTDFSRMRFFESPALPAIHAEALTQGSRTYFAPGRFSPGSQSGRQMIGHEFSHAAAQSRGVGTGSGVLLHAGLEARADREGALAARGEQVTDAPRTIAGQRTGVPAQGYFTLLPGDYLLDSDGAKTPFTTHEYHHIGTTNAANPVLTGYANEFTAPPVAAVPPAIGVPPMAAVLNADPGGNTQEMRDLKLSDQAPNQTMQNRALRSTRLEIHRRITDQYAQGMGSQNPAFQQNISKMVGTGVDRYAAVGVRRYAGKVALHVADNGDFAVNAQTTEPKEAYMTNAAIALYNATAAAAAGAHGNTVTLHAFPGNVVTVPTAAPAAAAAPPVAGAAGTVNLVMARPSFTGDFQSGPTFDCGEFSRHVCPRIDLHDSFALETDRMNIRRTDPGEAMVRSGLISNWFTKLLGYVLPLESGRTRARLEQDKQTVIAPPTVPPLPMQQERAAREDFLDTLQTPIPARLAGNMLGNPGEFRASKQDVDTDNWDGVEWPDHTPGAPHKDLHNLTGHALQGVIRHMSGLASAMEMDELARVLMGDPAQGKTPQDDLRRVLDEEDEYGTAYNLGAGINAYAQPPAGQGYQIFTTLGDGWIYHYGGVIAVAAGDTLTLENYEKTGELGVLQLEFAKEQEALMQTVPAPTPAAIAALSALQDTKYQFYRQELMKTWYFNIQGTQKPGQTFHEKAAVTGSYGAASETWVR